MSKGYDYFYVPNGIHKLNLWTNKLSDSITQVITSYIWPCGIIKPGIQIILVCAYLYKCYLKQTVGLIDSEINNLIVKYTFVQTWNLCIE